MDSDLQGFDLQGSALRRQVAAFEAFFKLIGFKPRQGRVWGLLVLSPAPLSAADICGALSMSAGSVSDCLRDLHEWGAATATFSPDRRCKLHTAVPDTLQIVKTVLRRRELLGIGAFEASARESLAQILESHGEADPRVAVLRSIVRTCEIVEATIRVFIAAPSVRESEDDSRLIRAVRRAASLGLRGALEISKLRSKGP